LTEWIQPLSLRAPEVFLGAPWEAIVELWGFACFVSLPFTFSGLLTDDEKIYELIQGRVLFRGRSGPKDAWTAEEDQIAQMIELFGPIPASLRKRGKFSRKNFDNGESWVWRVIFNRPPAYFPGNFIAYQAIIPVFTARSS